VFYNHVSTCVRWAVQAAKRLVEPPDSIHDTAERIRFRFLTALYLLAAVGIATILPYRYWSDTGLLNGPGLGSISAVCGLLMLIPYWLVLHGNARWANAIMLLLVTLLIFGLAYFSIDSLVTRTLNYLVLLVLFASQFASIRFTVFIAAFQVAGMLLLFKSINMPLLDALIGPIGFHVTVSLITLLFAYYRGRIEEERRVKLALSELRYRTVLERMPIYSYSFHHDAEGKLVQEWVTESFQKITGYTWDEVIGMGTIPLYHPDDAALERADAERAYREPTEGEYRIITRDKQVRWIHLMRHSVRDPDNPQQVSYYGIGQDITDRKLAEQEQIRAALQRQRLILMNDFVQAVSHDFRTSLATIETSRYLLQRGLSGSELEKALPRLSVIQQFVFHMEEQLENIHAITALANLTLRPCDLNAVTRSVIADDAIKSRQHQRQIIFQPAPELPMIRGDANELGRAIKHLVINALNYMEGDGTVTLRTFTADKRVVLSIEDNGIGIAREHLNKIFDLFYRVESARPLDSGGVGLGLSIVRMIVEAHNGTVTVESTPKVGSTFTLYFNADVN
jgi:PAS domain S-box-containing protein